MVVYIILYSNDVQLTSNHAANAFSAPVELIYLVEVFKIMVVVKCTIRYVNDITFRVVKVLHFLSMPLGSCSEIFRHTLADNTQVACPLSSMISEQDFQVIDRADVITKAYVEHRADKYCIWALRDIILKQINCILQIGMGDSDPNTLGVERIWIACFEALKKEVLVTTLFPQADSPNAILAGGCADVANIRSLENLVSKGDILRYFSSSN